MLDRINLLHYAFDACNKQMNFIMQFVVHLSRKLLHLYLSLIEIILHFHVHKQVIELRLCLSHLILRHLERLESRNLLF